MMTPLPNRHAISRAKLFLDLAELCTVMERNLHEAYLEAAIIFCRTAIHRLQNRYKKETGWKTWFDSLLDNASVVFIREERDVILKEAPPKVGQIIGLGATSNFAKHLYYYERPDIPAVNTIREHVGKVEKIILEGEYKFGNGAEIKA